MLKSKTKTWRHFLDTSSDLSQGVDTNWRKAENTNYEWIVNWTICVQNKNRIWLFVFTLNPYMYMWANRNDLKPSEQSINFEHSEYHFFDIASLASDQASHHGFKGHLVSLRHFWCHQNYRYCMEKWNPIALL